MITPRTTQKVFVALSGGVDSAVAAALLKEQGHDVTGVYMENWRKSKLTPQCTTEEDRKDALRVALHLGIPFEVVNFEKEYEEKVIEYFYREYEGGRTPNPDVMCNKEIKFRAFLEKAMSLGAEKIATGHYAQVEERPDGYHMRKGVDPNKDQTYFLHTMTQKQLSHSYFPIGGMLKPDVRKKRPAIYDYRMPNDLIARGICFVGQVNIVQLLRQRIAETPGPVVDATRKIVGEHRGLAFYTIGQREGLGIGGGVPYYVAAKEPATNTLVVAHGNRDQALYSARLTAQHPHWISGTEPNFPLRCDAVIRYRQAPQSATVSATATGLDLRFAAPQRAVTPGQSVVLYDGDDCLGGAVIEAGE